MHTNLDAASAAQQGSDLSPVAGGEYELLEEEEEERVLSWNNFRRDGEGNIEREDLWSVVRNEHTVLGLCYMSRQSSTPFRTRC
mmetsp:Transcript_23730/g.63830  ORF Transcript_23730/g.63830 Transcript_23730/m.63830 type:complete len:84 (+) Transcript_23730:121-372(+)